MPLNLQTKLLKYLDDKQFRRLGGTKAINVECATISDTMNQLEKQLLATSRQQCRTTREMADFLNISQPSVVRKLKKTRPLGHNFRPWVL